MAIRLPHGSQTATEISLFAFDSTGPKAYQLIRALPLVAGTSADAGYIRSCCKTNPTSALILPEIVCKPRKEAGFRQLGGFDHIDKKADLTHEQKGELQKAWRKESGYNDRWAVEIAFIQTGPR